MKEDSQQKLFQYAASSWSHFLLHLCLLASAYTIVGSLIRDETGTWNPVFVYPNSKTKTIITPHWLISPKPILFHLNSKYQKKEYDGQPVTTLYLILWYTLYSDPKKLYSLTILDSCQPIIFIVLLHNLLEFASKDKSGPTIIKELVKICLIFFPYQNNSVWKCFCHHLDVISSDLL